MRTHAQLAAFLTLTAPSATALAQAGTGNNYDRILTADDITITQTPGPGGLPGGWQLRATAWLANASSDGVARDMGCTLYLAVNGVVVSTTQQAVMVGVNTGGGAGCLTSCVTDGWCAACKPSIILPGTCYCSNNAISTEVAIPSLSPGDVVTAWCVPLPGSVPELAAANDGGVKIVTIPGGSNRAVKPGMVHYGRTASGAYALAGEVELHKELDGTTRDLSYRVSVYVDGTEVVFPPAGGGGGGADCPPDARIISVGQGMPLSMTPPTFLCDQFCFFCSYTLGQQNGNICVPPLGNPSGNPYCFCYDSCSFARIVPGQGWQVQVPQLPPDAQIIVTITPFGPSLPETLTSDDTTMVTVAEAALCQAHLADVGSQGGAALGDGAWDNNDFVVYVDHFFSRDRRADVGQQGGQFGPDGRYDNNDFVVFIDLFFAGC